MLAQERQQKIITKVIQEGNVTIQHLAQEFGVTSETIRRDLAILEGKKDSGIIKTHGGVMRKTSMEQDFSLEFRLKQHSEEKKCIGSYAMTRVEDGDVLYMPAIGSCVCAVAKLQGIHNLIVVTPSLDIATIISDKINDGIITGEVYMFGSRINPKHRSFLPDALSAETYRGLHFTKAFVGASALSLQGPALYNIDAVNLNKIIMQQSDQVFLLAESSKFHKSSVFRYADYSDFDCFITDDSTPIPPEVYQSLQTHEVELVQLSTHS